MPSQASVTTAIQYTPPSAAANSGQVSYVQTCNYNAQNVGAIDVTPSEMSGTDFSVPFGSVSALKMLVLKNLQSTEIGVKINGGQKLAASSATAAVTVVGPTVTISGLSGMTPQMVGGTLKLLGAASSGNNGTFAIAAYVSPTSVVITNPSAVTADANNGAILAIASAVADNFRIAPGGELAYMCSAAPSSEPITSLDVVTTATPVAVEYIQYFVFGD